MRVPDGVDEAAVRRELLDAFNMEIGAGLGPLAGRIWRVGLMGAGSTLANVLLFLTALERVLGNGRLPERRHRRRRGGRRSGGRALTNRRRRRVAPARGCGPLGRAVLALLAVGFGCAAYAYLTLPDVRLLRTQNPTTTAFIELRAREARARGEPPRRLQRWVPYSRISSNLTRAVLVAEDGKFWQHDGVDYEQLRDAMELNVERMEFVRGAQHHHAAARQEPLSLAVEESRSASCASCSSRAGSKRSCRSSASSSSI